jgi:hypothetical protein
VIAVLIASYLICAVVYLGLAFLLALHSERRPPALALIGACAITGAWAAFTAVAAALNTRPRKTLGWKTPAESLNDHLRSIQHNTVARTP